MSSSLAAASADASGALATRYQGDVSVDRPAQMPSWWQADWRSIDVSIDSWAARWDNLKQGVAGAIDHPSGPFAAAGIKSDDLDYRRLTPTYEAFVEVGEGGRERERKSEREVPYQERSAIITPCVHLPCDVSRPETHLFALPWIDIRASFETGEQIGSRFYFQGLVFSA